jgi:hypothetical protein
MKTTYIFAIVALILASGVMAALNTNEACGTDGFNCECKEFYHGDSKYYTIAKWEYSNDAYALTQQNKLYGYFSTDVTGNLNAADWTSNLNVYSVLVKSGEETIAFDGRSEGSVNSITGINHITFCGYKHGGNSGSRGASVGCTGSSCSSNTNSNGVPEFSTLTIGAAVLVVTLGLVFLRKR